MKSSIGNIWITGLVITFMLLFSGYLAVTISYSSAIKDKNYILSIIEKKNGITKINGSAANTSLTSVRPKGTKVYNGFGSLETINLFLRGSSYKQQGSCGSGVGDASGINGRSGIQWYGVKELYKDNSSVKVSGNTATVHVKYEKITASNKRKKYYYCFAKIPVNTTTRSNLPTPAYYRIRLFYALELPIVDALVFTIDGKTDIVEKPSTCEIEEFRGSWTCNNK